MRWSRFRLNYEILATLLDLPTEAKIVHIETSWQFYPGSIEIYMEHPAFEEIEVGAMIPTINPTYRIEKMGKMVFEDWGTNEGEGG